MASAPKQVSASPPYEKLPSRLRSVWRLCKLGYRQEPKLMRMAFWWSQLAAIPDALLALWLALLGKGMTESRADLITIASLALGVSAAATWFLGTASTRVQRRFHDKVSIALEAHVAELHASISTLAHQERPEFLDRLAILRDQVFVLDQMYQSLFTTFGWLLRLAITVGLLVSIHPALAWLAVAALPTVITSTWRPGAERGASEAAAQTNRLARHLFLLATSAAAGKELRVTRVGEHIVTSRREAWQAGHALISASRWDSATWHASAWLIFAGAFTAAIVAVAYGLNAPASSVLLLLAAGSRLSFYIGSAVGEIGFLRGFGMDGARRLAWLEDYASAIAAQGDLPAPLALESGIRLDHVSFAYPGTQQLVLEDVSLFLPAGSVVAIVGVNGAGKTTLVKLLAKMYEPSAGEIFADDVPLARVDPEEWRTRMAGAFQDFFRFELLTRETIGLGDILWFRDHAKLSAAIDRAGARDVVARLPRGLETQLGPTWPGGVELSFGQWQKLALARGFMREDPLLLILDEPTAALDAETEHVLFERYAAASRHGNHGANGNGAHGRNGGIIVFVSHRFSTVRMADLIVVLDGARLVEVGSHQELMAKGGQYAELYRLQANAYN